MNVWNNSGARNLVENIVNMVSQGNILKKPIQISMS